MLPTAATLGWVRLAGTTTAGQRCQVNRTALPLVKMSQA
jgi:hypothetical protein